MKEEIKITKEDLVMWLDRPPSDDDFDLCSYLAKAVENQKKYYEENKSLQSQLKAKEEAVEKFEKYLKDCISELENNYGASSIQNAINTGIVDITKVILSKFNEILSKGENK